METALTSIRLCNQPSAAGTSGGRQLTKAQARSLSLFRSLQHLSTKSSSEVQDTTELSAEDSIGLSEFWDAKL